ncbi:VCBS repeat-containing protein [Microbacterium sp.]|uniref:FG-GAP repeat domain-containing protein n=1 Tax=Microbacterium sp. TaxID=51671 RepID=UPI00333F316A
MPRSSRFVATLVAVLALILGAAAPVEAAQSTPATVVASGAVGGPVKATLVGFAPGNLVSDAVFTAKDTMTEAQIQAFFDSKVKTCQSGYTCLKDFRITSVNRPADTYCKGYTGGANESAARIIYKVSQSCGINPQVIIIMLQKEQGLVTHTWPSTWRYDSALGQGCPDDAPCNPQYVGFFHQIYGAARQMQVYMEGRYFTWYAPGKTWNILYNPSQSCGSSPVYIANKATAAMYYYTPYQPNAAALRAGYGTGDGCSAYGNRNFYNYFTDWFGSTQTPSGNETPEQPKPTPKITSFDKDSYVVAADTAGGVYAYPYDNGEWGLRLSIASMPGLKSLIGVGDLDGDGHRDLIATTATGTFLLSGDGDGGFSAPEKLAVNWSGATRITAAGDFDGDGIPDVFTVDAAGQLWLWPGTNRGGFGKAKVVGVGWNTMPTIVGGVDVNGDGIPDLFARDAAGALYVYLGAKDAKWNGRVNAGVGFHTIDKLFVPGDVTGDGIPDIMGIDPAGAMSMFRGSRAGALANGPRSGTGWGSMSVITGPGPIAGAPRPRPAAVASGIGDVDRDGAQDVAGLDASGTVQVYRGAGTGGWRGAIPAATGWDPKDRLVSLGDFNGDGEQDLGRIKADGTFWLYPGTGKGTYGAPKEIGQGWNQIAAVVGGIDFDGDGTIDVIGRKADGTLLLYRGDGKGWWLPGPKTIGNGWDIGTMIINAGDIDGDGISDILLRRKDGTLWLYPTDGAGGWGTPRQVGNGWNLMNSIIAPGDFNGDGVPDLLARDGSGNLWLYPGAGNATWGARKQVGNGWMMFTSLG